MKEPKEIGFVFEEIGLREAETLVAAGDGKYSDIVLMLVEKLPQIEKSNMGLPTEERKSFGFKLPGNQAIDEKTVKHICHSVNVSLTKQGVTWLLRYSRKKMLFVCVPKKAKGVKANEPFKRGGRKYPEGINQHLLDLKNKGLTYSQIIEQTGVRYNSIGSGISKAKKKLEKNPAAGDYRTETAIRNADLLEDRARRNAEMVSLRRAGMPYKELQEKFHMSSAGVANALKKGGMLK